MLESAEKEIQKAKDLWNDASFKALRDQQELDFGYYGPWKYATPPEQGAWDDITSPHTKTLATKVINILSASWMQLFIEMDADRPEREKASKTERFANGCIWLEDNSRRVPSKRKILYTTSSHSVIRAGTATSVLVYKNDKGETCVDIKSYDPFRIQWIEGDDDLLWFCNRDYLTETYMKQNYSNLLDRHNEFDYGTADSQGFYTRYTFWDKDEWKVAIGNQYLPDEGEKHGLGYIPVFINPCGFLPFMHSDLYKDTLKWSWMSVFHNVRNIIPAQSQMLSILFSKAKEAGKIKGIAEYDGSGSGGQIPAEIHKLGYSQGQRNEMVFLDISKGQKFIQTVEPPSNQQVIETYQTLRGLDILSTIDPIAYGQMSRTGSGALAAELRSAALEFTIPFKENVQETFKFIANECVSQFKNGAFESIYVEGKDSKQNKFYEDIKPADITDKYHFSCELVADRLRDQALELSAAIQEVTNGLSSRKTAMVKHNLHADPDREMDNMEEELAAQDPVLSNYRLAKYYKDQGDYEMAGYYFTKAEMEERLQAEMSRQQILGQGANPSGSPMNPPQAEFARIQNEPMKLPDIGETNAT